MGQTTEGVVLWEEFNWPDLAERLKEMKMVLWCFGTTEQHGPHLPLSVDTIDVFEVASRVSQRTGVFLIPPMTYGCSQMHGRAFPGTLSLRPQTLIKVIEDICEWLYNSGVRKIFLLNGHYGNYGPMLCGAYNCQYDLPEDLQIKFYSWWDHPEVWELLVKDVPEGEKYIHANWAETAGVLATRPDLVQMDKAVNEDDVFTQFDYTLEQVTHSGVCGRNTTGATPEDGEMILQKAADVVSEMVEQMLVEEIPIKIPRGTPTKTRYKPPTG